MTEPLHAALATILAGRSLYGVLTDKNGNPASERVPVSFPGTWPPLNVLPGRLAEEFRIYEAGTDAQLLAVSLRNFRAVETRQEA